MRRALEGDGDLGAAARCLRMPPEVELVGEVASVGAPWAEHVDDPTAELLLPLLL